MTYKQLLTKLKKYTDENYHNESILLLCQYYKLEKYISIMEHIISICKLEGSTPYHIVQYRSTVYNTVINILKMRSPYGIVIWKEIQSCF
jgi:hypothetical protein